MEQRIAIFPGSFDPITNGHINIIERAIPLFDKIIVAIGVNSQKKYMFPLEQRLGWLHEIFSGKPTIEIDHYEGLTVDYCLHRNAFFILRGVRNALDFGYERTISLVNKTMFPQIETIMYASAPEYAHVSSTIVRELIKYHGKFESFVPECVSRDASKLPPM